MKGKNRFLILRPFDGGTETVNAARIIRYNPRTDEHKGTYIRFNDGTSGMYHDEADDLDAVLDAKDVAWATGAYWRENERDGDHP